MNPNSSLLDRAGLDRAKRRQAARPRPRRRRRRRIVPRIHASPRCWCSTTAGSSRRPTTPARASACARSRTRRSATPMPPTCRRPPSRAPPTRCARSRAAIPAAMPRPPAAPTCKLYGDDNPLAAPAFEAKVKLLETIDAYARGKDERVRQVTASLGASWQVVEIVRPDGETYRDIRPLVRVNVSVVAGSGDRQESGSYGYGGREGYQRFIDPAAWQQRRRRGGAPGADQSRIDPGARRRDGRGARPRLARRDAARGGRPRPRRRLQPQADLGLRRPDGPAGRAPRASPWSTTAPSQAAAARSRSTTRARRPTAPC